MESGIFWGTYLVYRIKSRAIFNVHFQPVGGTNLKVSVLSTFMLLVPIKNKRFTVKCIMIYIKADINV